MSSQDSLYDVVHTQFREAFGQPHNLQGGGEQWTLQPSAKFKTSIHILLNGTANNPGVWVFDPHDRHDGVKNTPITERRQISELITLIQERLSFANREEDKSSPSLT